MEAEKVRWDVMRPAAVPLNFSYARFFLALKRLLSPTGMLYDENTNQYQVGKLKAA
ncbi:hypothetical protein SAY87_019789 [Trapa incisa]|uniref:Uncharacterized protein n=1 Tax=Trapa incisa TaxID=236973 RepID=A0AAN7JZT1_9MYRT|nr:hypothetical protein SAY87_019789 [Trapa incisa]